MLAKQRFRKPPIASSILVASSKRCRRCLKLLSKPRTGRIRGRTGLCRYCNGRVRSQSLLDSGRKLSTLSIQNAKFARRLLKRLDVAV